MITTQLKPYLEYCLISLVFVWLNMNTPKPETIKNTVTTYSQLIFTAQYQKSND